MKIYQFCLFGMTRPLLTVSLLAAEGFVNRNQSVSFSKLNERKLHSEKYKPSWEISRSLEAYVERVKCEIDDQFETDEGRKCTGEPSVDPSRQVQANYGDSEWINDW
jgi:hypothetical protein